MSLVEMGSLFAFQMEGIFKKLFTKTSGGGEGMAENGRKRCAFYLPFRI